MATANDVRRAMRIANNLKQLAEIQKEIKIWITDAATETFDSTTGTISTMPAELVEIECSKLLDKELAKEMLAVYNRLANTQLENYTPCYCGNSGYLTHQDDNKDCPRNK